MLLRFVLLLAEPTRQQSATGFRGWRDANLRWIAEIQSPRLVVLLPLATVITPNTDEVAAILKTHHWQSDALIERIAALHSYEVPCVVSWPIDKIVGSYADWVEDTVIRDG